VFLSDRKILEMLTAFFVLPAERAYNKALATLSEIVALPQLRTEETGSSLGQGSSSIFSLFFPNVQGHGPFASTLRIAIKLRNRSWVPSFVSSMFSGDAAGTKQDEETHVDAAKVILLLQHSSSLGNLDALFTLATISLVCCNHYSGKTLHFFDK
jgi:SEL1 protein